MPKDKEPEKRVIVEEILTPTIEPEKKIEEKPDKEDNPDKEDKPVEKKVRDKPSTNFNIFWIILPGIMLLGLLMGGIVAYYSGLNKLKSSEEAITKNTTPQPTITAESSPSASPAAKIDLTKYKIKILNGTGIKGEAGRVQTLIETAGFSVLSAGNAATYDYTKTQITIKTGVDPDFVSALVATLKKSYQLEDPKTVSSQTNDITIIVGNLKAL